MKNLLKLLIAVAAITCVASIYAVPTLTMTDSATATTVTVTDGGGGDSCGSPGCVTFVGTVGDWTINVDTGLTKPATGNATNIEMDLSFDASTRNHAATSMTITWSDSGYSGRFNLVDVLGGTQTAGMTATDFIKINGVTVLTLGPFTTSPYSGTAATTSAITLTPTDVVTLVMVLSKPSSTGASFTGTGDKNLHAVPDGGSAVALLGIALAGIEGARRMFRVRRKA